MVCGYCGDKNHNISHCPYDNELVNLLYSSEDVDFSSLSYKVLRKIASRTLNKTSFSKYKLVEIFNKIKKDHNNKQKICNHSQECAICYEIIGKTQKDFFEIYGETKFKVNELYNINTKWYKEYNATTN